MSTPCSASTAGRALPSLVGQPAQDVDVERAHRRRAAEQAAAEAGALLVGPVDEGDGDRRGAVGGERPQQLEPGHHAERAVEPAALGHAVEVAADDEHVVGRRRAGPPTGCRRRRCRPRPAASAAPRAAAPWPPATPASTPGGGTPPARRCGRPAGAGRSPPGRRRRRRSSSWSTYVRSLRYACRIRLRPFDWEVPATTGGGIARGWDHAQVPAVDRRVRAGLRRRPATPSSTR